MLTPDAAHLSGASESAAERHFLKPKRRVRSHLFGLFHAQCFAIVDDRESGDGAELARQRTDAHTRDSRDFSQCGGLLQMAAQPILHPMDTRMQMRAMAHVRTQLRIVAAAALVQHKAASAIRRDARTAIALDEVQGHVDSGRSASACNYLPIINEQHLVRYLR